MPPICPPRSPAPSTVKEEGQKQKKLVRFDFPPGATPEKIVEAIAKMRKKD